MAGLLNVSKKNNAEGMLNKISKRTRKVKGFSEQDQNYYKDLHIPSKDKLVSLMK